MANEAGSAAHIYTAPELVALARKAGFTDSEAPIAASIALAESGGRTDAHNSKPPDDSYGLWQINMRGTLGPKRRIQFGIKSNDQLYDPTLNANAAHIVYKESGWDAWTTHKSKKNVSKLDEILTGIRASGGIAGYIAGGIADSKDVATGKAQLNLDPMAGIASAINSVGSNIFKGISNIAAIGIAAVAFAAGLALIISQTKAGKGAVKAVGNTALAVAVPEAAVAKGLVGKGAKAALNKAKKAKP